jgi:hypothetical protein
MMRMATMLEAGRGEFYGRVGGVDLPGLHRRKAVAECSPSYKRVSCVLSFNSSITLTDSKELLPVHC